MMTYPKLLICAFQGNQTPYTEKEQRHFVFTLKFIVSIRHVSGSENGAADNLSHVHVLISTPPTLNP